MKTAEKHNIPNDLARIVTGKIHQGITMKKRNTALKAILAPLVEMINTTYGHYQSGLVITETPEPEDDPVVFIDVRVTDRDAEIFGRVIATLLVRGGLRSAMHPLDMEWDPIDFYFHKEINTDAHYISPSYSLVAFAQVNYNKRAAKRQVALLQGILADPRNLNLDVPSALSLSDRGPEVPSIAA